MTEIQLTDSNFRQEVLEATLPVLVDFWAPWCGPCRMVAPTIEEIAREYDQQLKVGKLNVDENPGIAQQYRIMSIPTLILFKGGKPAETVVGVVSHRALKEKIQAHVS